MDKQNQVYQWREMFNEKGEEIGVRPVRVYPVTYVLRDTSKAQAWGLFIVMVVGLLAAVIKFVI